MEYQYNYSLSFVLGGIGILVLVVALVLRSVTRGNEPEPAGEDLLAAAEAEREKGRRGEREKGSNPESTIAAEPEEQSKIENQKSKIESEVSWNESSDVYRPTAVDAASFVQGLDLHPAPQIQAKQTYIFIHRPVYEQVQAHLKTDTKVELGGLLFGRPFVDNERSIYLVIIEAAVPAAEAQELPNSLTYTPETWQQITPQMQQMDPDWTLVGSYHSHPGMGVFLSSTDLDTQAEVFSQDWQVALVVDPLADTVGFYAGRNGKACPGWQII